jgi:hypothetical protein
MADPREVTRLVLPGFGGMWATVLAALRVAGVAEADRAALRAGDMAEADRAALRAGGVPSAEVPRVDRSGTR